MGRFAFFLWCILLLMISSNPTEMVDLTVIDNFEENHFDTNNFTSMDDLQNSNIFESSVNLDLSIDMAFPVFAIVKPVFTATAYSGYYNCYSGFTNYKNCFSKPLVDTWSTSYGAVNFIEALKMNGYPDDNIITISDIDVHNGNILDLNGKPRYDTIVFFHNEYVTLKEYHNMVNFIKAGGNVIIYNGNAFFGEVIYDASTNHVNLVSGHGWNFDGENGSSSDVYQSRFRNGVYNNEHQSWFGSRYSMYAAGKTNGAIFRMNNTNPHPIAVEMKRSGVDVMTPTYWSFEDNTLITQNAHIIADWDTDYPQRDRGIKIYEIFPEGPIGGSLIHFGFFGTDIRTFDDDTAQKTFVTALRHQSGYYNNPWIKYPYNNGVLNYDIVLDFITGWNTEVYINDTFFPSLTRGSNLDFLQEGDYKVEIKFSNENDTVARSVRFRIDRTPPRFLFNNKPTLELPTDYPETELIVSLDDLNPDYMRVRVLDGTHTTSWAQESGELNPIVFSTNLPNGKFISLEGIDSAGNSVVDWYTYNSSAIVNFTREIQPFLEKVNTTFLKVSIPSIAPNVSGRLQVSEDYGVNWQNVPFTELNTTTDREYAYYKRNSSQILYRIAIKADGETHYIQNIKSYNWDNTIFSLKNHNVTTYGRNHTQYMFHLHKSQVQNTSIAVQWLNINRTILQIQDFGYHSDVNQYLYANIPAYIVGTNIIRIIVNSSELIWSYELKFIAGYPNIPENKENSVDEGVTRNYYLMNLGEEYDRIAAIRLNFISNGFEIDRTIGINSLGKISFSVMPNQDLKIYSYDSLGNLVKSERYLNLPDVDGPNIISIKNVYIYDNESHQTILQWQVYDNAPGRYEIYQNNILIQVGEFTNNIDVEISLLQMEVGIYNITILTFDIYNNRSSYTTMLHVLDSTIIPTVTEIMSTTTSRTVISTTTIDSFSENKSTKSSTSFLSIISFLALLVIITTRGFRSKIYKCNQ